MLGSVETVYRGLGQPLSPRLLHTNVSYYYSYYNILDTRILDNNNNSSE